MADHEALSELGQYRRPRTCASDNFQCSSTRLKFLRLYKSWVKKAKAAPAARSDSGQYRRPRTCALENYLTALLLIPSNALAKRVFMHLRNAINLTVDYTRRFCGQYRSEFRLQKGPHGNYEKYRKGTFGEIAKSIAFVLSDHGRYFSLLTDFLCIKW